MTIEGEVDERDGGTRTVELQLFGPGLRQRLGHGRIDAEGRVALLKSGLDENGTYVFGVKGRGDAEFKHDIRVEKMPPARTTTQRKTTIRQKTLRTSPMMR